MYCIFKDGVFSACSGNVEFSSTVFQSAESLSDDQRAEFSVFEVVDERAPLLPDHKYVDEWTYRVVNGKVVRTWAQKLIPQAERDQMLQQKFDELWQDADLYQTRFISGVAIGLLTIGVLQGKPKALAIQAWSASMWDEYYRRKALLTYDGAVDGDFTACGPMPHSVPELRAELGL